MTWGCLGHYFGKTLVLQSITEYYRVLQSITEYYRVLQSAEFLAFQMENYPRTNNLLQFPTSVLTLVILRPWQSCGRTVLFFALMDLEWDVQALEAIPVEGGGELLVPLSLPCCCSIQVFGRVPRQSQLDELYLHHF